MKKYKRIIPIVSIIVFLTIFCNISQAKVIYVDDDASGANNGSSWENAYIYLQDAFADANSAEKPVEIRVAQGIYKPDKGANITAGDYAVSFGLINGVTVLGGYAGINVADSNTRDVELYETILSGDLLNNDAEQIDPNNLINEPTFYDNSFHVVTGSFTDETAILDGFTITSGNASGYFIDTDGYFTNFGSISRGGGIYIEQGNPVILNCTFTLNGAYEGGAIYNTGSDPNINNCRFIGNCANYYDYISPLGGTGGAIYNIQSSPILTGCQFIENLGSSGAGIYNINDSNTVLTNCRFYRNTTNLAQGGGLFNAVSSPIMKDCNFCENYAATFGGGIANEDFANPVIDKCVFTANKAEDSGGAIYNTNVSEPNITSCIFTGNSAVSKGGAVANEFSDPNLNNCTFIDNKAYIAGGFDNYYGNPSLFACTFTNNSADSKAGAIQNMLGNPVVTNCIFSGNSALSGGALLNTGGYVKFINCTLLGNFAGISGHAVQNISFMFPPNMFVPGTIDFLNCIVWNGENAILNQNGSSIIINYCDVQNGLLAIDDYAQGLAWGQGNIDADPCFVESGYWVDVNDPNIIVEPADANAVWLEGDYHLKSAAGRYDPNSETWIIDDVNSPCIDAGDPNSSFADEPLPNGGRINMGAYGGTPQASKSPQEPLITIWTIISRRQINFIPK